MMIIAEMSTAGLDEYRDYIWKVLNNAKPNPTDGEVAFFMLAWDGLIPYP